MSVLHLDLFFITHMNTDNVYDVIVMMDTDHSHMIHRVPIEIEKYVLRL